MASQTSALSKKPKTNETNFEKNITEVTGKTNKNDAINSIISIREVELHGVPMQCVCGTWCTSKIYFYQVLSKPNSAIKIGNACRNKYLKKKKRKVCKNINKKLLERVINEGEKNIDLKDHQRNTWLFLVRLGKDLDIPLIDLTKQMQTMEEEMIEQGCNIPHYIQKKFEICKLKRIKIYRKRKRFKGRTFRDHQILIAKHYNLTEEFDLGYFTLWIKNKKLDKNFETDYEFNYTIKNSASEKLKLRIHKNFMKIK